LLFAVTEPHAAISGLRSGKALALIAATAGAWAVGRALVAAVVPWRFARLLLFVVPAAVVLKVVVFPVYGDHTVVEAPPAAIASAAAGPIGARSGPLHGIDHRASGTARLYRTHDGRLVVGLEGIAVQPGPHYVVYLVPGAGRRGTTGGARLGDLRGNRGSQFYAVPSTGSLAGPLTVLIWCETFGVPVANATL
jgi:hypothetical protein